MHHAAVVEVKRYAPCNLLAKLHAPRTVFHDMLQRHGKTRGSAMAEGPRDAIVSRNSVTTKHPI